MNLSDLQLKEIIDISTGKKLGNIIDIIIDNKGYITKILLDNRKSRTRLFQSNKEEAYIKWENILKLGDDIIIVDSTNKN